MLGVLEMEVEALWSEQNNALDSAQKTLLTWTKYLDKESCDGPDEVGEIRALSPTSKC